LKQAGGINLVLYLLMIGIVKIVLFLKMNFSLFWNIKNYEKNIKTLLEKAKYT
jgi:hypothetical protein